MILKVLFYILFGLPLVFQMIFGIKAIRGNGPIKLWLVSLLSCVGQLSVTIINSYLMAMFIRQAESHDGLPMIGVLAVNMIFGVLLLFVILIQSVIQYRLTRAKKHNKQTTPLDSK
ncbi:hypothetical protein [Sunxiuqinia dokdonensis]|uniref:MotA/TolQ/ExbB proton channel domain-containing protein n=1 Tax=Sunxiuqinia dokdonensis TaxID=1409788 RepID=A0A0L8V8D2_9BACT|nr:hypothetical protein [Sunxiuqinia dokdonensis]KOH44730.1 hypothetical protein NC99_24690 [Sunxiuqinia dokdonensis]